MKHGETVNSGIQDISVSSVRDYHSDCCCCQECRKLPICSFLSACAIYTLKGHLTLQRGFRVSGVDLVLSTHTSHHIPHPPDGLDSSLKSGQKENRQTGITSTRLSALDLVVYILTIELYLNWHICCKMGKLRLDVIEPIFPLQHRALCTN